VMSWCTEERLIGFAPFLVRNFVLLGFFWGVGLARHWVVCRANKGTAYCLVNGLWRHVGAMMDETETKRGEEVVVGTTTSLAPFR